MKRRFLCLIALVVLLSGGCASAFPQYYTIPELGKAQAEARQRHLPIAWLGSGDESWLTMSNLLSGGAAELTQMAMADLQGRAVVVYFDGKNMAPVPDLVHMQFHVHDDGELSGGASWIQPKIAFTNPDVTRTLGRVSETDMKREREAAINSALQIIANDPTSLAAQPVVSPTASSAGMQPAVASVPATSPWDWLSLNGIYIVLGVAIAVVLFLMVRSRGSQG